MEISFAGQNIAVTGAAAGIGLATAKALAALKADVYVADMAKEPPAELRDLPNVHFTGGCDVSQRSACKEFMDSIPGRLDGLINGAGITLTEGKIATDDVFQRVMAVNVTGTWNMGTEALKRMSEQEIKYASGLFTGVKKEIGRGSIVNISSGAGVRAVPGLAVYCASKHAVIGLTRVWAADFPHVRVNAVLPGATDTSLFAGITQEQKDTLEKRQPKGRFGVPEDIADVLIFCLSDASAWITGQLLPANGGSH